MFGGRTHTQINRQSETCVRILDSEFAIWLKQSIPEFVYCSVRACPWLLHHGQQRGHQQLQGHPPGDGQVAWLMIMMMAIATLTMIVAWRMILMMTIVALTMIVALARSVKLMITMMSAAILMIVMTVTLTRRSVVVNTKPLLLNLDNDAQGGRRSTWRPRTRSFWLRRSRQHLLDSPFR